ncbi:fimbria/pilus outer membrane usher protein [Pseudomonas graminis]|uniref:Fimbrial protein n=1 Tax=Pseudomonas graminis TaxID=158627 RepID=A0A1C2DUY8_9PSED|nr:fimbrial protein [Pseudomonas graminis]
MALASSATAMTDQTSAATDVKFNTSFIQGTDQPADLATFLHGNSVVPGTYRVDVYVNRVLSGRRDISFIANPAKGTVEACLTLDMLRQFGMNPEAVHAGDASSTECFDLPARVEFARVDYQPASLRLNISIPQAMMLRSARGYVPPELWDEGETVGFVNYNFSGARRTRSGQGRSHAQDQYYLSLRNGVNLGAWRLRNESSLTYGNDQPYRFRSNRTFVQRDLTAMKGQLTLGETFTDSQVFDSVRFLGAMVMSDEGMLPDSERIFAPVIRGIADTNALVEVRQNGFMLYSGNVSPGPFEITDIYPSGSNGDLEVTVVEADGSKRVFVQAYASLPIMVPKGALRYSLAAGQYDSNTEDGLSPGFTSGTAVYGLTERVTAAGGVQIAEDYQAGNIGAGVNTGLGAVSLDVTQSLSRQREQRYSGQSLRVRYANTLDLTQTTLAVAGYRYSTNQYLTFDDHVDALQARDGSASARAKDRLEISLTQSLPAQGASLSFTGSEQRYWDRGSKTRQFFLSWNSAWRSLSYSLSVERNQTFERSGDNRSDNRIALTLSLPLGSESGSSRVFGNAVRDSSGASSVQSGLNGQLFDDRNSFYSVQAGYDSESGSSGFGKLSTTTAYGRFDAGYGQGRDYQALSLGASGSVVAHGGGVNLGQPLGETFALVQVKDVSGARLSNFSNVETADNGYAILPYAQPYRTNWVNLDTRQLGADVELENAVDQVVPRRGAAPLISFRTAIGRRVQFELVRADGSRLPMGAAVEDEQGKPLATVDPSGRALVLSERDSGELIVKWTDQQCRASFVLPPKETHRSYDRLKVQCL